MAPGKSEENQVEQVIADVTLGYISIEEAARRLNILETEAEFATCATCRRFRSNLCIRPGHPMRPEHPDSFRCEEDYERRDPRDEALPVEAVVPRNSKTKMFK